mmetsp:Transcript_1805/g.6653  ORF Transcript_1805/g.6653 Transcript_1805/m.6653 type:complete len:232 (+) Transcript_1805:302-997(+)
MGGFHSVHSLSFMGVLLLVCSTMKEWPRSTFSSMALSTLALSKTLMLAESTDPTPGPPAREPASNPGPLGALGAPHFRPNMVATLAGPPSLRIASARSILPALERYSLVGKLPPSHFWFSCTKSARWSRSIWRFRSFRSALSVRRVAALFVRFLLPTVAIPSRRSARSPWSPPEGGGLNAWHETSSLGRFSPKTKTTTCRARDLVDDVGLPAERPDELHGDTEVPAATDRR